MPDFGKIPVKMHYLQTKYKKYKRCRKNNRYCINNEKHTVEIFAEIKKNYYVQKNSFDSFYAMILKLILPCRFNGYMTAFLL